MGNSNGVEEHTCNDEIKKTTDDLIDHTVGNFFGGDAVQNGYASQAPPVPQPPERDCYSPSRALDPV